MISKKRNLNNITFVIHPTEYQDYDILAIGSFHLLRQLALKVKHSNLIKKSKYGGIAILIIDTCDTIRDANHIIKQWTAKPVKTTIKK